MIPRCVHLPRAVLAALLLMGLGASGCATSSPELPDADREPITPVVMLQTDARAHYIAAQGRDGFTLSRLRAGLDVTFAPWAAALAQGELGEEGPAVLDAFVDLAPLRGFGLRLGYSRNPLFVSGRDERTPDFAIPERSPIVRALWPDRQLGLELRYRQLRGPLEIWASLSNGTSNLPGNDEDSLATSARLDLSWGRAHWRHPDRRGLGLRVGLGASLDLGQGQGLIAQNPLDDLVLFASGPVSGPGLLTEGHLVAFAGDLRLLLEGGLALEQRLEQGNETDLRHAGLSAEIAWTLLGQARLPGAPPTGKPTPDAIWNPGALELAARYDWIAFAQGSTSTTPVDAMGGALALRWWINDLLTLSAASTILAFDQPPDNLPALDLAINGLLRFTVRWD